MSGNFVLSSLYEPWFVLTNKRYKNISYGIFVLLSELCPGGGSLGARGSKNPNMAIWHIKLKVMMRGTEYK